MRRCLLLLNLLIWSLCIGAQQRIKGLVTDTHGEPLAGIVVKALASEDQLMGYGVSDGEGRYEIILTADKLATRVAFNGMGYHKVERKVGKGENNLGRIIMEETDVELREVTVKAPPVRTTGDTITYNVGQLRDKTDRTIEDVIKKIPGVDVDQQGRIKYQGEDINKFYIEGLDMLGGRYTLATQNINPDDIASISVYEHHQPKRVLQGIEYSKQAALNLKMKRSSMLRPIVTATVGAGYGDEPLWLAEGTGLFIAPKKQFLLTAKTNNAGMFYDKEVTNFAATNLFPTPLARDMLSSAATGGARIPQDRYQSNRSATGSLNSIWKLREDHTLTTNAGYYFNRLGTWQSQETRYWQQSLDDIVTRETIDGTNKEHGGWMTLGYEKNEKQGYLSEELNAEGTLGWMTDRVGSGRPLCQNIRTDYYAVDNRVSAVWRRGDRLFCLNSDVSVAQVPQSSLQAIYTADDSLFVNQEITGLTFHTAESTSYGWLLGRRSVLSLNTHLQADYDQLSSSADIAEGQYRGYQIRTAVFPTYKYDTEHLHLSIRVPLQMVDLRFTDRLSDQSLSYHRPMVSTETSLSYRPNKKTSLGIGGEIAHTLGNLTNIVTAPIHTTYRNSQVFGTGLLTQNHRYSTYASASYRNPLRGNNFSLQARYQRGHSNQMAGSNVSPEQTQTLWLQTKNTSDVWTVTLNAAKNLLGQGTVLTASANLNTLATNTLRQSDIYRLTNTNLTLKAGSHSTLLRRKLFFDIDLIYTLSTQKIEMTDGNNLRNDITPSVRLTVCPTDEWEVYVRPYMGYVQNNNGRYDDNFYLDGGVRYTHKRFEAELQGKNLTNQRYYTQRRFVALDQYLYQYRLRPLEVVLLFKVNF